MKVDSSHSISNSVSQSVANSSSNSNIENEQTLLDKLKSEYVSRFVDEMNRLKRVAALVHDNTYHNIESPHHIAYKYKVNKDEKYPTRLISDDKCRAYEFLIEFDKKDFAYGIYYGCRGLILDGNQEEQINFMIEEWEKLKPIVITVLNNTFPDIDFTKRFQPTNNASNKTFWPFWISLGIEEDVIDIAARATTLIAKAYIEYLTKDLPIVDCSIRKKKPAVKTYFTDEAYEAILTKLEKKGLRDRFEDFIRIAKKKKVIKEAGQYEKCFQFTNLNMIESIYFIQNISEEIFTSKIKKQSKSGSSKIQTPWTFFTPVFLSKEGTILEYAKQYSNYSDIRKSTKQEEKANKELKKVKEEMDKLQNN